MAMTKQARLAVRTILQSDGFDKDLDKITQSIKDNKTEYANAAAKAKAFGTETDRLSAKEKQLTNDIDEQKKAVDILNKALEKARQQHGENSEVTKNFANEAKWAQTQLYKYEGQLNDTKEALDKAAKAEDKAGDEAKKMGGQLDKTGKSTAKLDGEVKQFAKNAVQQFTTVAGILAVVVKGFNATKDALLAAAEQSKELVNLSQTTGMLINSYQEWDYILKTVDYSMEQMSGDMAALGEKAMDAANGVGEGAELFGELGIKVTDANGALKTQQEIFEETIEALQGMTDETKKNAIASALLSTSGEKLAPVLNMTKDEVQNLKDEANEAGIVIGKGVTAQLAVFQSELDKTSAITEANVKRLTASLAVAGTAFSKQWARITGWPEKLGIKEMAWLQGVTEQESAKLYDQGLLMMAAAEAMDLSGEALKQETDKLKDVLISTGVPAAEAETEAIYLLTQGMDSLKYKTQYAADAQTNFDATINSALANYEAKNQQYLNAIAATTEQYLSQLGGLFDAFPERLDENGEKVEKTSDDLIGALQSQVDAANKWEAGLKAAADRGVNQGIIDELKKMGPKAQPELEALINMSDENLTIYQELFAEKSAYARDMAVEELKPLKDEVDTQLQAVQDAIAAKEEGMKEVGRKLGAGVVDGVEEAMSGLTSSVVADVEEAIKKATQAMATQTGQFTYNTGSSSNSGIPAYGSGTVATRPHLAVVGDEPEVIVPLNNSRRSRDLLEYANAKMGGGSRSGVVIEKIELNVQTNTINDEDIPRLARRMARAMDRELGRLQS